MADDDELAELVLEHGTPEKQHRPPLEGWTDQMEALASIQDLLLAIASRGSGKPPPRLPRPQTALERVERQRVVARHESVLDTLLPGRH